MTLRKAKIIVMSVAYGSVAYTRGEYFKACSIYEKHLMDNDKKTQG